MRECTNCRIIDYSFKYLSAQTENRHPALLPGEQMKLVRFQSHGHQGWAVWDAAATAWRGTTQSQPGYPGDVDDLIRQGRAALDAAALAMAQQPVVDMDAVQFLAPVARPAKIICVGLNYRDHT